jgi:hypothetical protein
VTHTPPGQALRQPPSLIGGVSYIATPCCPSGFPFATHDSLLTNFQVSGMGKYLFAWILGVPAIVLVGIYLVAHL